MSNCCGECAHWKNQNKHLYKMKITASVSDQEVGACWKLQRALVEPIETDVKSGIINLLFKWIPGCAYTVESFCCNMFTEITKPKIQRG